MTPKIVDCMKQTVKALTTFPTGQKVRVHFSFFLLNGYYSKIKKLKSRKLFRYYNLASLQQPIALPACQCPRKLSGWESQN